jgi:hypothetical protein
LWRSTDKLWKAGERQLSHFEDTAERQLRAYISARKGRINNVIAGSIPAAVIKIKNTGQTPAYELMGFFGITFVPYPFQRIPDVPKPDVLSKTSLAPNQTINLRAETATAIEQRHIDALRDGNGAFFIGGLIEYVDAFRRPRIKRMRMMYTQRSYAAGSNRLEICPEGNEET